MQEWTLETIRKEGALFSWLEESRFMWVPPTAQAIRQVLQGRTIVLITDKERQWLGKYIMTALNKPSMERPMIPMVCLDHIYAHYDSITGGDMIDMLDDMLGLSFKGEYLFWYIGKGDDKRADIAKRNDDSYLWLMDEDFQNAFRLASYDPLIDIKLLQLYRLFDMTLSAALFGEIDVDE